MKLVHDASQGELSEWRMLRIGLLSCGEPPKHRFDSVKTGGQPADQHRLRSFGVQEKLHCQVDAES